MCDPPLSIDPAGSQSFLRGGRYVKRVYRRPLVTTCSPRARHRDGTVTDVSVPAGIPRRLLTVIASAPVSLPPNSAVAFRRAAVAVLLARGDGHRRGADRGRARRV